ncbi:MAG: hypothetical protein NVSMB65_08650 [Chloroflexota bacterium]
MLEDLVRRYRDRFGDLEPDRCHCESTLSAQPWSICLKATPSPMRQTPGKVEAPGLDPVVAG